MTRPWFALEVTASCTRSCVFCYNYWKAPGSIPPDSLSGPDLRRLVRKLAAEARPSGITLTGGEPLLREDLEELASECSRLFPAVALSTTGDGLTPARASRLLSAGVLNFEVALPSADAAISRELCGTDCTASRKAIALLSGMGGFVTASVVLCARTAPGIRQAILMASACGARAVVMNPFLPSGAGLGRADLVLAPADLAEAAIEASSAAARARLPVYFGTALRRCEFPDAVLEDCPSGPCVCGSGKWAIGPRGELRPCEQSPADLGSLMELPFGELARSSAVESFRAVPEGCRNCRSLPECHGGCRPARFPR